MELIEIKLQLTAVGSVPHQLVAIIPKDTPVSLIVTALEAQSAMLKSSIGRKLSEATTSEEWHEALSKLTYGELDITSEISTKY